MRLESRGSFRWAVKIIKANNSLSCKIDNKKTNKKRGLEMEKFLLHKTMLDFLKMKNLILFSSRLTNLRSLFTKFARDSKGTLLRLSHRPNSWLKRNVLKTINTINCTKTIATQITATFPIGESQTVHTTGGNPMKGATHFWKTLLLSNNLA